MNLGTSSGVSPYFQTVFEEDTLTSTRDKKIKTQKVQQMAKVIEVDSTEPWRLVKVQWWRKSMRQ